MQDPHDAAFPEMPRTALELAKPAHVVPLERMSALLDRLVRQPAGEPHEASAAVRFEVEIARGERRDVMSQIEAIDAIGQRSVLSCPDCSGVMWEIDEGELTRYRCHVGHTYGAELMSLALDENLRRALASAQRALEERVALAKRLHRQAEQSGHPHMMSNWAARVRESEQEAKVVRDTIRRMGEVAARSEPQRRTIAR